MQNFPGENKNRLVIITGMSGSGKTSALRALEDIGYFCIDNLPVVLLPKVIKIRSEASCQPARVALVMDLREEGFLKRYKQVFRRLQEKGHFIEVIFLDAADEVLLQRYSETRRVHPLCTTGSILESIAVEREKLAPLKAMAAKIIDTTFLNVHQVKATIQRLFLSGQIHEKQLFLHIFSFGFRYGVPLNADMIFDVRFLANPFFVKHLKELDGNDPRVEEYVLSGDEAQQFRTKLHDLINFLLPLYENEGKTRLSIAFGCTGGRHRSVVMANALGAGLASSGYPFNVTHRDISKSDHIAPACP